MSRRWKVRTGASIAAALTGVGILLLPYVLFPERGGGIAEDALLGRKEALGRDRFFLDSAGTPSSRNPGLDILRSGRSVKGTVRDADSRRPIEGAWVCLTPRRKGGKPMGESTRSGPDGRFEVHGPGEGEYILSANAEGYSWIEEGVSNGQGSMREFDLELSKLENIRCYTKYFKAQAIIDFQVDRDRKIIMPSIPSDQLTGDRIENSMNPEESDIWMTGQIIDGSDLGYWVPSMFEEPTDEDRIGEARRRPTTGEPLRGPQPRSAP